MPLFDANTLAVYRGLQADNLIHDCDLIGFAKSRTPTGSTNLTPFVAATVKCRIQVASAGLVVQAEQKTLQADYVVYLPAATDLSNITRLTVRGSTAGSAWTLELVDLKFDEPRSYSASTKVRASRATDTLTPPPLVATVTITEV